MVVVSVSLPSGLVRRLSELASRMGYRSRSELIKEAIIEYLSSRGETEDAPYTVIVVVSDHESEPKVNRRIIDVVHDYKAEIVSYQHQMLEAGLCVTTIIVRGPPTRIAPIIRSLRGVRGVLEVRQLGVGSARKSVE